jgi:hypothetical protein
MKISCPGCGKTYQVPQSLIDAILEKHRSEPVDIDPGLFLPVMHPPAKPAAIPPSRNQLAMAVKILMLIATLLWPVTIVALTFTSYQTSMRSATVAGTWDGEQHYMTPDYGLTTSNSVATTAFAASLFGVTLLYGLGMTFLGVIWFVVRR